MTVPQVGDNRLEASNGKSFNLEVAFADFLADETRTELALPPMTTEQRKEAKRLAEQYPDIKCESFGFGEERRLHLFKTQNGTAPTGLTRTGSEKSTTASEVDTPSTANTSHEVNFGSVFSELIQIRNTFIHVEVSDCVDQRMVQSMPHGMFGKCWEEEVQKMKGDAKKTANQAAKQTVPREDSQEEVSSVVHSDAGSTRTEEAPPRVAVPPPPKQAPQGFFAPGCDVFVEGLTKCPAFNGLSGRVQSLDKQSGRYDVLLISNNGYQLAKIKGENLRIAVPPPPAQRPEDFHRVAPISQAPAEVPAPMTMCGGFQMPGQPCWYEQHMHGQHMQHMQPVYAHHPHDPYMYAPVCPAR